MKKGYGPFSGRKRFTVRFVTFPALFTALVGTASNTSDALLFASTQ